MTTIYALWKEKKVVKFKPQLNIRKTKHMNPLPKGIF